MAGNMITQTDLNGTKIDIEPVRQKLRDERNLDIAFLLPDRVEAVLPAHLTQAGVTDCTAYASVLEESEDECDALVNDLLAPPKRFFEDPALTSLLYDEILPSVLQEKPAGEPIRVWVTNCGEGYLPYEIALLLQKLMRDTNDPHPLRILASFSDELTARKARWRDFLPGIFEELEKTWPVVGQVEQALRQARNLIVFGIHDPLTQMPYAGIDLLLSPGYLPLLSTIRRDAVVGKFIHSLLIDGILVLGRGEQMTLEPAQHTDERPFCVFRKKVAHPYELRRYFTTPESLLAVSPECLHQFPDAVIVVDPNGIVLAANPEATHAFPKNGELEGKQVQEITPSAVGSALDDATNRCIQTGTSAIAGDPDWTAAAVRIAERAGGAAAAIAIVPNALCIAGATARSMKPQELCRSRALEAAGLAAEVWSRENQVKMITRQASVLTENLYTRNQQLAQATDELQQRNQQMLIANEQLELAVAQKDSAEADLQQQLSRQRRIADTLQEGLLPDLPARVENYLLVKRYTAASAEAEVGGDFYHGGKIDDDRYLIALGDVAGKGLDAAVLGAMTKYMLMGFAGETPDPGMILLRLNEALVAQQAGQTDIFFITLACALINIRTNTIHYANGGHEPAMLYRSSGRQVERLQPTGKALGVTGGHDYDRLEISMQPGDTLVLYTDGFTDAGVPNNALGIDGVAEVVRRSAERPPDEVLEALYQAAVNRIPNGKLRDDAASLPLKREV